MPCVLIVIVLVCSLSLLLARQLYGLCQLFPEAASKAMQTTLVDSAHSMEEVLEVKGRAAFPQLDMVLLTFLIWFCFPLLCCVIVMDCYLFLRETLLYMSSQGKSQGNARLTSVDPVPFVL